MQWTWVGQNCNSLVSMWWTIALFKVFINDMPATNFPRWRKPRIHFLRSCMAGASLFLSFLPLLPKQILVTNLMTDFPEMTIASDNVDDEMVRLPRRWDLRFIRRFMLTFGLISSIFDYMTFGALILLFHATDIQFRTGWFTESVMSACLVVLVIRTRKSFYHSKPSRYLLAAILIIVGLTLLLPISPLAGVLGFKPLTIGVLLAIFCIVALYILTAEVVKKIFYKKLQAMPVTISVKRKIRMTRRWDKFAIPLPFNRIDIRFHEPMEVTRNSDRDPLGAIKNEIKQTMEMGCN